MNMRISVYREGEKAGQPFRADITNSPSTFPYYIGVSK
jgi:hypothetical protein